jgi:gamma-glutamyltranspeptidase/glutathione hydrolase
MSAEPFQSRPMAMGRHGAVSSPHALASAAAIDALQAGGNAVDAAVTAAAVATVVQPFSSSIGGVGWATVYDRSSRSCEAVQFHGAAPAQLDPGAFRAGANGLVDWRALEAAGQSLLGSLVPGVVAGWDAMLRRKGRWPLARALGPAIALARDGFPVSELLHAMLETSADRLRGWPTSARVFLPNGRLPRVGERLVQADLGRTLEAIARIGAAECTVGATGRALVEFFGAHGGALAGQDLATYRPSWHTPLTTTYRGRTVHATGTALGDVSFVAGLQLLDRFGPFAGPLDPDYVHTSVELAKLVNGDRIRRLGPGVGAAEIDRLLGPEHMRALAEQVPPRAATAGVRDAPTPTVEDTITLTVVDEEGNAVHLMQTVGTLFGTAAVIGTTGILANSSLYFAYAGNDGANRVVPGMGVEQNPCLAIVCDAQGDLELIVGSPGGKTRVETVRQMLANVVDFGLNVQQSVDASRFLNAPDGSSIEFERRYGPLDPRLRAALEDRGHHVSIVDDVFGSGQAIAIDAASGTRMAAADWRRESVALAY